MTSQQLDRARELAREVKSDLSHSEVEHLDDGTIRLKVWPKGMKIDDESDDNTIKDCRISSTGQVLPLGSRHGVVL